MACLVLFSFVDNRSARPDSG